MSRFGKLSDENSQTLSGRFSRVVESVFEALKNWYANILSWGLRHKITVALTAIALFIGSIALLPAGFIGFTFMPEIDKGEFVITLDMNPQLTVYQNNQLTMQTEKIIAAKPEVKRVYTNVGTSGRSTKNNITAITVQMVDKKERKVEVQDFAQQIKDEIMADIPGVRARASLVGLMGGGGAEPIQFIVQGTDYEQVQEAANLVLDIVRNTPGTADAKLSIDDPRQEVQIKLDREKMAALGLSVSDVGATLRTSLNGNNNSKYRDGNYEYDIRIGIDNFDRMNSEDVAKLTFMNKKGELIELKQFADISYGLGASALERINRISSITVKSNVVGRPSGTVGAEIQDALKELPAGVTVKPSGMLERQGSAFGSLGFAFLAAIVLIYLIMVVLYNSLLDPVIVLFSIPLSFIGAFLALALTMNTLNIFSIIGLIVLIGLVAKNAILLVDFTNHIRKEQELSIFDALIEAGKERLRPILMTTFAMIFGMLPIALAAGNGAEIKNGMAWVIIGGLTSSMILTLIVVPVVYYIFHRISDKITIRKWNKLRKKAGKRMMIETV